MRARRKWLIALVVANVACAWVCMTHYMLTGQWHALPIVIAINLPLGTWAAMRV